MCTVSASLRLRAITAPRTRNAFGSPNGLTPTQVTFVPQMSPKSCRRRRIAPAAVRRQTMPLCPRCRAESVNGCSVCSMKHVPFLCLILCRDHVFCAVNMYYVNSI